MGRIQAAGQQEPPDGGVDEGRGTVPQMGRPSALADLVADQRILGGRIGDAQDRLRQAHQRDAFLGRERELLQQHLRQAFGCREPRLVAQRGRQPPREIHDRPVVGRGLEFVEQASDQLVFRPPIIRRDGRAFPVCGARPAAKASKGMGQGVVDCMDALLSPCGVRQESV